MRRQICSLWFLILGLILLSQGCIDYDETDRYYDITVVNETKYTFGFYLDDVYQFTISPGESVTLKSVQSGTHTLKALVSGFAVAERTLYLNRDTEWTVSG